MGCMGAAAPPSSSALVIKSGSLLTQFQTKQNNTQSTGRQYVLHSVTWWLHLQDVKNSHIVVTKHMDMGAKSSTVKTTDSYLLAINTRKHNAALLARVLPGSISPATTVLPALARELDLLPPGARAAARFCPKWLAVLRPAMRHAP